MSTGSHMSNANLDAALSFLQRFPNAKLFPSRWAAPKGQTHPTHCPLVRWSEQSSGEVEQVKEWASSCEYFCIALEQSGLTVIDTDNKKGKSGDAVLLGLEIDHGDVPNTLVVSTPSGGRHQVFYGSCAMGANKLGLGVDIPVMIPVPGSTVPGKGTYSITHDAPIAALPDWVPAIAGKPREKAECPQSAEVELDLAHNVIAAVEVLKGAPEAIEGYGGDAMALQVALRVRDLGISEDTCADLMHRFYADKCSPYDPDWLQGKVENAYRYASGTLGSRTAEAAFKDVVVPEDEDKPRTIAVRAADLDIMDTPAREWILGTRLIRKFMTVLISPGGGSKSTLTMTEMLAVATGKPLTGDPVLVQGPVWIINSEDPRDEIQRRLAALCMHFGIDHKAALQNVFITGKEFRPVFARTVRGAPTKSERIIRTMEDFITENGIVVWSLDPFVRAHQIQENDNTGIDMVAEVVSGICDRTNSACTISHHTRKGADISGNMDAARGASSLVSAARIADTLSVMQEKEAKAVGIDPKRRRWYVRLDDAKANMRPPSDDARWFERVSVTLPNGKDKVGVLKPVEFDVVEEMDPFHRTITELLALEMSDGDRWTVNQAAQLLAEKHGRRLADESNKVPAVRTIAGHLMRLYAMPVELGRLQIRYVEDGGRGKNGSHFLVARRVSADEM